MGRLEILARAVLVGSLLCATLPLGGSPVAAADDPAPCLALTVAPFTVRSLTVALPDVSPEDRIASTLRDALPRVNVASSSDLEAWLAHEAAEQLKDNEELEKRVAAGEDRRALEEEMDERQARRRAERPVPGTDASSDALLVTGSIAQAGGGTVAIRAVLRREARQIASAFESIAIAEDESELAAALEAAVTRVAEQFVEPINRESLCAELSPEEWRIDFEKPEQRRVVYTLKVHDLKGNPVSDLPVTYLPSHPGGSLSERNPELKGGMATTTYTLEQKKSMRMQASVTAPSGRVITREATLHVLSDLLLEIQGGGKYDASAAQLVKELLGPLGIEAELEGGGEQIDRVRVRLALDEETGEVSGEGEWEATLHYEPIKGRLDGGLFSVEAETERLYNVELKGQVTVYGQIDQATRRAKVIVAGAAFSDEERPVQGSGEGEWAGVKTGRRSSASADHSSLLMLQFDILLEPGAKEHVVTTIDAFGYAGEHDATIVQWWLPPAR